MFVLLNVIIMIVMVLGLYYMQKKYVSFTKRVFIALGMGIVYGIALQLAYGLDSEIITNSIPWFDIIGVGYVRLLQMIVMPLIMVSITSAITNLKSSKQLGRMSGLIIAILIGTTAISASVGILSAKVFKLSAVGMEAGDLEAQRTKYLEETLVDVGNMTVSERITEVIPTNPFLDMTGQRRTSTLSVVIFSALIGIATLGVEKKKPESAKLFKDMINSVHDVIMRLVTLILRLTPFGILALMTKTIATSSVGGIMKLLNFAVASYAAIILMFIIHLLLIGISRLNPFVYLKKSLPTLTFAFTSRSSAGSIPMNIETQTKKLGVPEQIANLSASLGASIGQNGCAGIYPAMLAVMIAPTVGVNPFEISFIIKLIVITALSSFGVAGVGGGATFASLIVLSSMNLPVGLVGLLISIEPLIDMGRTALNVSGSMVSGVLTGKFLKEIDLEIYNNKEIE